MPIIDCPPEFPVALDNNIFTHLRNKQRYALEQIKRHLINTGQFPAIPSTTVFEANFGIQNGIVKDKFTTDQAHYQTQEINRILANHLVISFDQRASEIAAYILSNALV